MSDVNFEIEPGPIELAMVVDDTGSMAEEIGAVRTALTNTINRLAADTTKPFPTTAIVTFKDDVTTRIISNDPTKLQPVVNALVASEGRRLSGVVDRRADRGRQPAGAGGHGDAVHRRRRASGRPVPDRRLERLSAEVAAVVGAALRLLRWVAASRRPGDVFEAVRQPRLQPERATGSSGLFRQPAETTPHRMCWGLESSVRTFAELATQTRGTFTAIPEVNFSARTA